MARPPKGTELRSTQFVLRQLASPFRQRILAVLYFEKGPLTHTEVARRLGVSDDSSVNFHLHRLTGGLVANYVQKTPQGLRSLYAITEDGVAWMRRLGLNKRDSLEALLEPSDELAPRSW